MKKLRDFMTFQADSFFKEKLLQVVSINEWIDYDTKERLGTKVEVVIVSDKTPYSVKPDERVTNRFEKINVKVKKDAVVARPNDKVRLVNPECKVWGDYSNQLSVTCDDLEVLTPKKA